MLAAAGIAIVAFVIKWPVFALPLTGYFGSYQAINAMMADGMGGGAIADFFVPRTFILMNGQPGLHLLYYPFGALAAFLGNFFGGGGIPWWGRFQAGCHVLLASLFLYPVAKRFVPPARALLAVFFFSFFPMVLLSGVVLQNEAAALFFLVFSFWLLGFRSWAAALMGGVFFSLALTARLHFIVALPAFVLFLNRDRLKRGRSLCFLFGSVLPVSIWTVWIYGLQIKFPDFVQTSFFTQSDEGRVFALSQFLSLDFYKRIFIILGTYWCTPILAPFALIGAVRFRCVDRSILAWVWGSLALIVLLPRKVMDHPFYLLVGAPALALLIASYLGCVWVRWGRWMKGLFCAAFLLLAIRFYLPSAMHLSDSEKTIAAIGAFVQNVSEPGDRVVASHGSSGDLLFYCRRHGWPFDLNMSMEGALSSNQKRAREQVSRGYGNPVKWLEYLRTQGAKYLVLAEPERFKENGVFSGYVRENYREMTTENSRFHMFNLEGSL